METTIAQVNLEIALISVKSQAYQHVTLYIKLNFYAQLVKKQILWFPVFAVKHDGNCHIVILYP